MCPSPRSKTIEADRRDLAGTQPGVHGTRVRQGEPFAQRRQEGAQFATRASGVMQSWRTGLSAERCFA